MPQSRWWLTALIAPLAYFVAIGSRYKGFTGQPGLVHAWSTAEFEVQLAAVGGAAAARSGVLVDVGFAALLVGALGLSIAGAGGRWQWVLPALVLDLGEGLALWVIVGADAPSPTAVHLLHVLAVAKLLAYGVSLIVLARALVVGSQRHH